MRGEEEKEHVVQTTEYQASHPKIFHYGTKLGVFNPKENKIHIL